MDVSLVLLWLAGKSDICNTLYDIIDETLGQMIDSVENGLCRYGFFLGIAMDNLISLCSLVRLLHCGVVPCKQEQIISLVC